jgi:hypothetical protein
MATTSIGIIYNADPVVDVRQLEASFTNAGAVFIVIRLGEDVTVIPSGVDREQSQYARALAAALLAAADEVDAKVAARLEASVPVTA